MAKTIKYETCGVKCITPCYTKIRKNQSPHCDFVGSVKCKQCEFFIADNGKSVTCSAD